MTPTFFTPIQGTWGWDENPKDGTIWWEQKSAFTEMMQKRGLVQLPSKRAFCWSTDLEGFQVWQRLLHTAKHKHRIWRAGALALCYFVDSDNGCIPYYNRNFIAHSHGLQVVAYACGVYGLQIRNLVTVGSPIREDMHEVTLQALPNIANWAHIYDPHKDVVGTLGEFDDGRFRLPWQKRLAPLADKLFPVLGAEHSGTLNDPKYFSVWEEAGEWLRRDGPYPRAAKSN